MLRKLIGGAAGLVFLAGATGAQATAISGVGEPISEPTLAGGTIIDFDSGPVGSFNTQTFGNVTFTGVDAPFTIGLDFNGQFNTEGGLSLFNDFDFIPRQFRFDFATAVDAFAFNWGAADFTWLLSAFDSGNNLIESFVVPPTFGSNSGEYFGIAASGIAFATLETLSGDYVFIDDFTYQAGSIIDVPEPATLALFGGGLVFLALLLHRRRRLAADAGPAMSLPA